MSTAATLSSGEKLAGPKALELQRLSRWHSRKQKGSRNRRKSALRLARLHARISNVRQDWLHQTTTRLVREFAVLGIEDLNVRGMMGRAKLAGGSPTSAFMPTSGNSAPATRKSAGSPCGIGRPHATGPTWRPHERLVCIHLVGAARA